MQQRSCPFEYRQSRLRQCLLLTVLLLTGALQQFGQEDAYVDEMPLPVTAGNTDEEPAYAERPRRMKKLGDLLTVRTRFAAGLHESHLLLHN